MATTELTFNEQVDDNGKICYVAETTVNSDYGLHMERKRKGVFRIMQRFTDSGEYAESRVPYILTDTEEVIDVFISHGIYPMHLRIISYPEVTSGVIKEVTQ